MQRNDLCWCGSGKKYKKCHEDFDERLSEMKFDVFLGQCRPPKKIINNKEDIARIKAAGVINDGALDVAASLIKPGMDTATIDKAVHTLGLGRCMGFDLLALPLLSAFVSYICFNLMFFDCGVTF